MTEKENLIEKAKVLLRSEEFGKAIKILEDLYQQQPDVDVKNNLMDAQTPIFPFTFWASTVLP